MTAREGLEAVIKFAEILNKAIPYLVLLGDRSKKNRIAAMSAMVTKVEGWPQTMLEIVAISTPLSYDEVSNHITTEEFVRLLMAVIEVNAWDELWQVAASLEIVEKESLIDLALARFDKMRI